MGNTYVPGDSWAENLADEAQTKRFLELGALEVVETKSKPAKKSAPAKTPKKPEGKTADEKKKEGPEPVGENLGKTKLMEIAQRENVTLDETMTPAEMRLAINKARGVK